MSLQHLPASADPESVFAAMERDGACIVDDVLTASVIDQATSELEPYLAKTEVGPDDFSGRNTKRTGGLVARSASCRDLVMHPTTLGAARRWLAHATNIQLHLTQVIAIGPDSPAQLIHRDQWAFDFFPFPPGFEVQFNTIWAFTDFTELNGATRVVPGSHKAEDGLQYDESDTVPAEMSRGSVLCYNGSVYHGGGANRSDEVRVGVNITYNLGWLRQEENQYLAVPKELASTLPVDLLRLIGYDRGAYALGYINDMEDPIGAVRPDLGLTGFGNFDSAVETGERNLQA